MKNGRSPNHPVLRKLVSSAAVAGFLVSWSGALGAEPLTYGDVLKHLTDLDRLTTLQAGCKSGLFSSWDRGSRTRWGANGDAAQYVRIEPNGEAVMMDLDGPGVVYRIWSANPQGRIRVYLDGAEKPSYEWNFPDLFEGKLEPFIKPLVYRRDNAQSASDCYLPIPFGKHIRITADKAHGQYYHFNYVSFPKDQPVASFRLPLSREEMKALRQVAEVWSDPGRDPKPALPDQRRIVQKLTVPAGGTVDLAQLAGGGVIRAVRARVQSDQRYAWRKLVLRCVWDGAEWPQVMTPLGPFFGFDFDSADYGSLPAGCRGGKAYQYFPMPFKKSAKLSLQSFLEQPATVEFEYEWAPQTSAPADPVYFYARWRHEPDLVRFDYTFLETAGRGHFVGVSMPIEHPLDGWWGEGDEMVWVDDDDFPPYIGTGSEDYFGDAWGIRYLSGPSYGASSMQGHRTCNYRWHFADIIPFTKRMRMTIENYGPNGVGPRGQYDYSSTVFWYQVEATPPFETLRGVGFTGGSDPDSPPMKMEYEGNVFPEITPETIRTYGRGLTFAQQAEKLAANEVKAGSAKVVTDALRGYEFDREQAVDFGKVKAGQTLATLTVKVAKEGVYYPRIHTAPEGDVAELSVGFAGRLLQIASRPSRQELHLEGVFLKEGEHSVQLAAVTDGQGIFDCLQLSPASRFPEAIEAEEMAVLRATGGGSVPKPTDPVQGVSGGRALGFSATKPGEGYIVSLGKRPALPYVLGARPMVGPEAGIIQAFVGDKPIGPRFDLFARAGQLGSSILPLGVVPAGATEVEIRVVGRNARAKGWQAGLDYFRWEPSILGPGTKEGIWAQVAGKDGCDYRGQDLGGAYSDGHHLWVMPSRLNAWIDVGLEIPDARTYEIAVKFTKSWDYAVIRTTLDGKRFGPEVDTYASSVVAGDETVLGKAELSAGRHVLRFQAVGHNSESKGYLMGIDHVIVR